MGLKLLKGSTSWLGAESTVVRIIEPCSGCKLEVAQLRKGGEWKECAAPDVGRACVGESLNF